MIRITPDISIDPNLISMDFETMPEDVRARLKKLAGRKMTAAGILIIDARRHANQERNRSDAMDRLAELIRKAAVRPKPRRKTRPTLASKQRRLESKRRRGQTKKLRRSVRRDELS
jgi:ribosome-associated protein